MVFSHSGRNICMICEASRERICRNSQRFAVASDILWVYLEAKDRMVQHHAHILIHHKRCQISPAVSSPTCPLATLCSCSAIRRIRCMAPSKQAVQQYFLYRCRVEWSGFDPRSVVSAVELWITSRRVRISLPSLKAPPSVASIQRLGVVAINLNSFQIDFESVKGFYRCAVHTGNLRQAVRYFLAIG